MYIEVDIAGGRTHVREADSLQNFSVRVSGPAEPREVASTLGALGRLDATDHAWIDIEGLRAASGRADDPRWLSNFDAMVSYAASKGWVDDTGTALRAHLEFAAATG